MTTKPFGGKSYGSIGHFPTSRLGPGDHKIADGQARILTERARDRHDLIIVQEKLDGSNVGVGKMGGVIIPVSRAGWRAETSPYAQHHLFASWVAQNWGRFNDLLAEGERICGEWMAQAHGTRYALWHTPFVAFDLFRDGKRILWEELSARCDDAMIPTPSVLHRGGPCSIETAMERLGVHGHHGAIDKAEGAVWRCERKGCVDFLGKFVRPDKVDGIYLPELSGHDPVWNWQPSQPTQQALGL